jgi:hypothetical protein
MRERYLPLLFDENSNNWSNITEHSRNEREAEKELNEIDRIDEEILKVWDILCMVRSIYTYKDYIDRSVMYAINHHEMCDENSERKYKDKLESFFEINRKAKEYRNSIADQSNNSILSFYNNKVNIVETAIHFGLTIEETLIKLRQGQRLSNKIAYWNRIERIEKTYVDMYESLKKDGYTGNKDIYEFFGSRGTRVNNE